MIDTNAVESRAKQWGEICDLRSESMGMVSAARKSRAKQWGETRDTRNEDLGPVLAARVKVVMRQQHSRLTTLVDLAKDARIAAAVPQRDAMSKPATEQMIARKSAAGLSTPLDDAIADLTKLEPGNLVPEDKDVAIRSLLGNVATIVSSRAREKALHLVVDAEHLPRHLPRHLRGDLTMLTQALLSYASIAVKCTEKGTITIRAGLSRETEDRVLLRFEVAAPSAGTAPHNEDLLSAAPGKADSASTRAYDDTGLGLAITKQLAQFMGGDAGVTSTPALGSTLWFSAWLNKSAAVPTLGAQRVPGKAPEAILARDYGGRRVLLVEDDPLNQEIAVDLLSKARLFIDVADNGATAVEMARSVTYDLILMDMQMRKMDGLEATRRIRSVQDGKVSRPERRKLPFVAEVGN